MRVPTSSPRWSPRPRAPVTACFCSAARPARLRPPRRAFGAAHPSLQIAGTLEPSRVAVEEMDNTGILERLADARPDLLLVAFGNPKQERWIDMHREQLPVKVVIGVGCVFDLLAGRRERAPRWMQAIGLEWAFRLVQEPRRLLRRYASDAAWLTVLSLHTLRDRLRRRPVAKAA